MRRKLGGAIVLIVMIFSSILIIQFKNGTKTLESSLGIQPGSATRIIHEEKTDEGSIIFYFNEKEDSLYTAFIRKGLFGYENLYSSVHGDIMDMANKLDLSNQYFPAIKKTPFPIYFGIIGNKDIENIIVQDSNNSEKYKQAKIIETEETRIWLVYMDGLTGREFDVIGLSKDEKEITRLSERIPWPVEKKPIRSPYK
ncbi:MAG: hypothetical protein ACRDA5_04025 [Clostridium sp.]